MQFLEKSILLFFVISFVSYSLGVITLDSNSCTPVNAQLLTYSSATHTATFVINGNFLKLTVGSPLSFEQSSYLLKSFDVKTLKYNLLQCKNQPSKQIVSQNPSISPPSNIVSTKPKLLNDLKGCIAPPNFNPDSSYDYDCLKADLVLKFTDGNGDHTGKFIRIKSAVVNAFVFDRTKNVMGTTFYVEYDSNGIKTVWVPDEFEDFISEDVQTFNSNNQYTLFSQSVVSIGSSTPKGKTLVIVNLNFGLTNSVYSFALDIGSGKIGGTNGISFFDDVSVGYQSSSAAFSLVKALFSPVNNFNNVDQIIFDSASVISRYFLVPFKSRLDFDGQCLTLQSHASDNLDSFPIDYWSTDTNFNGLDYSNGQSIVNGNPQEINYFNAPGFFNQGDSSPFPVSWINSNERERMFVFATSKESSGTVPNPSTKSYSTRVAYETDFNSPLVFCSKPNSNALTDKASVSDCDYSSRINWVEPIDSNLVPKVKIFGLPFEVALMNLDSSDDMNSELVVGSSLPNLNGFHSQGEQLQSIVEKTIKKLLFKVKYKTIFTITIKNVDVKSKSVTVNIHLTVEAPIIGTKDLGNVDITAKEHELQEGYFGFGQTFALKVYQVDKYGKARFKIYSPILHFKSSKNGEFALRTGSLVTPTWRSRIILSKDDSKGGTNNLGISSLQLWKNDVDDLDVNYLRRITPDPLAYTLHYQGLNGNEYIKSTGSSLEGSFNYVYIPRNPGFDKLGILVNHKGDFKINPLKPSVVITIPEDLKFKNYERDLDGSLKQDTVGSFALMIDPNLGINGEFTGLLGQSQTNPLFGYKFTGNNPDFIYAIGANNFDFSKTTSFISPVNSKVASLDKTSANILLENGNHNSLTFKITSCETDDITFSDSGKSFKCLEVSQENKPSYYSISFSVKRQLQPETYNLFYVALETLEFKNKVDVTAGDIYLSYKTATGKHGGASVIKFILPRSSFDLCSNALSDEIGKICLQDRISSFVNDNLDGLSFRSNDATTTYGKLYQGYPISGSYPFYLTKLSKLFIYNNDFLNTILNFNPLTNVFETLYLFSNSQKTTEPISKKTNLDYMFSVNTSEFSGKIIYFLGAPWKIIRSFGDTGMYFIYSTPIENLKVDSSISPIPLTNFYNFIISPDGKNIYAASLDVDGSSSDLLTFSVLSDSSVMLTSSEHINDITHSVFISVSISPDGKNVYVVDSFNIRIYSRSYVDGKLTFVKNLKTNSPATTGDKGIAVSADGKFVFAITSDNTISSFARDSSGTINFVSSFSFKSKAEGFKTEVVASPDNKFVYVYDRIDPGYSSILVLNNVGGKLSEFRVIDLNSFTSSGQQISLISGLAFTSDSKTAYISFVGSKPTTSGLFVFNRLNDGTFSLNKEISDLPISDPLSILLAPNDRNLYFLDKRGYALTLYKLEKERNLLLGNTIGFETPDYKVSIKPGELKTVNGVTLLFNNYVSSNNPTTPSASITLIDQNLASKDTILSKGVFEKIYIKDGKVCYAVLLDYGIILTPDVSDPAYFYFTCTSVKLSTTSNPLKVDGSFDTPIYQDVLIPTGGSDYIIQATSDSVDLKVGDSLKLTNTVPGYELKYNGISSPISGNAPDGFELNPDVRASWKLCKFQCYKTIVLDKESSNDYYDLRFTKTDDPFNGVWFTDNIKFPLKIPSGMWHVTGKHSDGSDVDENVDATDCTSPTANINIHGGQCFGVLKLDSNPSSAHFSASLNGKNYGFQDITPFESQEPAGTYTVTFDKIRGYQQTIRQVTVTCDQTTNAVVDLTPDCFGSAVINTPVECRGDIQITPNTFPTSDNPQSSFFGSGIKSFNKVSSGSYSITLTPRAPNVIKVTQNFDVQCNKQTNVLLQCQSTDTCSGSVKYVGPKNSKGENLVATLRGTPVRILPPGCLRPCLSLGEKDYAPCGTLPISGVSDGSKLDSCAPPGDYTASLETYDPVYTCKDSKFTIQCGKQTDVNFDCNKLPTCTYNFVSDPVGAPILIDGKYFGNTNLMLELPKGKAVKLLIRPPVGYEPEYTDTINVDCPDSKPILYKKTFNKIPWTNFDVRSSVASTCVLYNWVDKTQTTTDGKLSKDYFVSQGQGYPPDECVSKALGKPGFTPSNLHLDAVPWNKMSSYATFYFYKNGYLPQLVYSQVTPGNNIIKVDLQPRKPALCFFHLLNRWPDGKSKLINLQVIVYQRGTGKFIGIFDVPKSNVLRGQPVFVNPQLKIDLDDSIYYFQFIGKGDAGSGHIIDLATNWYQVTPSIDCNFVFMQEIGGLGGGKIVELDQGIYSRPAVYTKTLNCPKPSKSFRC